MLGRREDSNNWSAFPNVDGEARDHLDACEWFEVYDVVEALAAKANDPAQFENGINEYFRKRGIGWQLSERRIQMRGPEAFEQIMSEAHQTLSAESRTTAAQEIREALRDLSRRPKPDITGSLQHALAALECVARDVTGEPTLTLGPIIKKNPALLPPPLDKAVVKLWGFASEKARHLREGREPSREDAELVVHVAAAVATYLSKKANG